MSEIMDDSQPVPKPGTVGIVDWIIKEYNLEKDKDGTPWARIRDMLIQRRAFGVEKYGLPLEAHNGRNPIKDLEEEIVDGFQYCEQAIIEARHIPRVQALAMIEMLECMVTDISNMMEK